MTKKSVEGEKEEKRELEKTMVQPTKGADLNPPTHEHEHQHQHQHQHQQWTLPHQYQQQWMGMQYPAVAMAMMQQQQMMMYHPHPYMGYSHYPYQHQQAQLQQQQPPPQKQQVQRQLSAEEVKTIWVGDLHHWMDENYLISCFAHTGEVFSVKVIRNKQTAQSEGYGFIEFYSQATAEKVLQNYNGAIMPNTEQPFRLNWATLSANDKRTDNSSDLSIFVGDLAADVTDSILQETFSSKFPSVKGAKVVTDANTGRSRGYGFVRFTDENERSKAIAEMNGKYCLSRPMRVGIATPKKAAAYQQSYSSQAQGPQLDGEANTTTIFVGGLDADVSDEDLRQPFSQFGDVVSVKIPVGKGCGFVQFASRKNAEDAMQGLNGTVMGKQTVRLSWGRSLGNKQWRSEMRN